MTEEEMREDERLASIAKQRYEMETTKDRHRLMRVLIDLILKEQQQIQDGLEETLSDPWLDRSRLAEVQDTYENIDELGSNLRHLEHQISQELKLSKSVRRDEHIYGQLPNRLTPSEVRSLMIVLLSIAVFATAMVFGSVFIGG